MDQTTFEKALKYRTPVESTFVNAKDAVELATKAAVEMGKRIKCNWVAMDREGTWFGYASKPFAHMKDGVWMDACGDHTLLPVPTFALTPWNITIAEVPHDG